MNMSVGRASGRFIAAAGIVLSGVSAGAAEVALVSHRAVYELSLATARETGGVRTVSGRIALEAQAMSCGDFELLYRQVMAMSSGEGDENVLDFRSTTRESADGAHFEFDSTTGSGDRDAAGLTVELAKPEPRSVQVEGDAVFPTAHMKQVIEAAQAGRSVTQITVYDGSDPADKATDTLAAIGERTTINGATAELLTRAGLTELDAWPVTISYFEARSQRDDQAPRFTYSTDLLENGISPNLRLDYGTFVLDGRLTDLELLESRACP